MARAVLTRGTPNSPYGLCRWLDGGASPSTSASAVSVGATGQPIGAFCLAPDVAFGYRQRDMAQLGGRRHARQRLLDLMVVRVGRAPLAAGLGVPLPVLDDWLAGKAPIPDAKVVALVDLIEETGEPGTLA
jgi:hypothetical protein